MTQLFRISPLLTRVAGLHLVLLVLSLIGLALDTRLVTGINPWIKPIKFDLSIAIYLMTMAWVFQFLPENRKNRLARGIAICMLIETFCLTLQVLRGVPSHFNFSTPFDASLFSIMGIAILINTFFILQATLVYFLNPPSTLDQTTLWGIRWGLVTFLLGSVLGGYLSSQTGHTVGVPEGGPGLPFLNWSTQGGDLRVAHFFGLHGIQFFLLLAWFFKRTMPTQKLRLIALSLAFVGYFCGTLSLFVQATQGQPLIQEGDRPVRTLLDPP
jgi:hypothetical protein